MKTYKEYKKEINIVAIQGSPRNENCCPAFVSKTQRLLDNAIKDREDVNFTVIDLSVKCDGVIVQPCKGCISTAGGYHCHFPCSCYNKGNKKEPDLMSEQDVYNKLKKCDGFFVFTPINWDSVSSVVKSFFDRLVCINLSLEVSDAKKILGEENLKNSEVTRKFAKKGEYDNLLKNHLEGKYAALFCQGDNGADDYNDSSKIPLAYKEYNKGKILRSNPRECLEPIIKQLSYSGVFVKDDCVDGVISGYGTSYPLNDDNLSKALFEKSRKVVDNLINHIKQK